MYYRVVEYLDTVSGIAYENGLVRSENTACSSHRVEKIGLLIVGRPGCGAVALCLGPQLWGSKTSAPAPTAVAIGRERSECLGSYYRSNLA
ncbi:MAG TPA: hypothetical protein VJL59_05695 [Anaerolineales bacterium]|nr:hypothetical protein [Anaerolineales bacterium]